MKILVQKFGGTSVANMERREMVVDKVIGAFERGYFPVVVASAIGRDGDSYATDTLIKYANAVSGETNPRELDLLMSCGELISCVVLANTIKKRGYDCVVLTGGQAGIITDDNYGDAEVLRVDSDKIMKYVDRNIIPVITGFQGMTEKGEVTTLGRGGSDVSGAIVGEALNAEAVEIYTDVDGVMTADPRVVPDAKVIEKIYYSEVFQMAEYGAKVIHPRAVEVAMRSNVPLWIKNTMNDSPGTLITGYDKNTKYKKDKNDKVITAVASIGSQVQVTIHYDGSAREFENDSSLFGLIANAGVSIDMINIYPDSKVFIIDEKQYKKLEKILNSKSFQYEVKTNCSKVTIIGSKMRGVPGVMAKMINALSKLNITVLQTSDSHMTISCLIDSNHTKDVVNALHEEFELGK